MKKLYLSIIVASSCLSSCDLLSPEEVLNPNVAASDFATSSQAMKVWVNGTQANLAVAVATFAENTGLLSDDLFNNSSRSSKTYDQLDILYTDNEVFKLSTHVGKMLQMTEFGLNTIAQNDEKTTQSELFTLRYIRALAYLLGGENFVALPREAHGQVMTSTELLGEALKELDLAATLAETNEQKAIVEIFRARALRGLGQLKEAATHADLSLTLADDVALCVQFDALHGYSNSLHEYIAADFFTVATQLLFEKAKFPSASYWDLPLAIAKSEEAYLILAESAALDNNLSEAQKQLSALTQLVAKRVASAATEKSTSVTILADVTAQIASATDRLSMLTLIYDLRQQVFFGEGRRSSDLGIRLPISQVEFNEYGNLPQAYTQPVIPAYLQGIRTELDQHSDLSSLLVKSLLAE